MKYRKKPVVIDAIQWNGYWTEEAQAFAGEWLKPTEPGEGIGVVAYYIKTYYIKTLEGDMWLSKGDFIIKGVNGEFYPCKPDIFEKTYEPV